MSKMKDIAIRADEYFANLVSTYGDRVFSKWNAPTDAVYIGRGSVYGNPIRLNNPKDEHEHKEVVAAYRLWVQNKLSSDEAFRNEVVKLHGKNVACYCSNGTTSFDEGARLCHGHILLAAADYLYNLGIVPEIETENGFKVEPYKFLSNMYPCKVHMYGQWYDSVEAAYQASKCADPRDREKFIGINGYEAKRLGRTVKMRDDFDSVKLTFMRELLKRKFSDINPTLMNKLMSTEGVKLVEYNTWNDKYWGICNGVGENYLGKLLMEIRKDLLSQ